MLLIRLYNSLDDSEVNKIINRNILFDRELSFFALLFQNDKSLYSKEGVALFLSISIFIFNAYVQEKKLFTVRLLQRFLGLLWSSFQPDNRVTLRQEP